MTGFVAYNEDGIIQFSSNLANIHLAAKGAITTSASFDAGLPGVRYWEVFYTPTGAARPMVAVMTPSGQSGVAPFQNTFSAGQWKFSFLTSSDVTQINYWIFDRLPVPSDTFGLQVFLPDGTNVWHSSQLPMRVMPPIISSDMPFKTWRTSPATDTNPIDENFTLTSGRQYAALFGTFSNYETYLYLGGGLYAFAYAVVVARFLSGGITTSGLWYSRETVTTTTPNPALESFNSRRLILPIDVTNY